MLGIFAPKKTYIFHFASHGQYKKTIGSYSSVFASIIFSKIGRDNFAYYLKQNPVKPKTKKVPLVPLKSLFGAIPYEVSPSDKDNFMLVFENNCFPISDQPQFDTTEKRRQNQVTADVVLQKSIHDESAANETQDARRMAFMLISSCVVGATVILGFLVLLKVFN